MEEEGGGDQETNQCASSSLGRLLLNPLLCPDVYGHSVAVCSISFRQRARSSHGSAAGRLSQPRPPQVQEAEKETLRAQRYDDVFLALSLSPSPSLTVDQRLFAVLVLRLSCTVKCVSSVFHEGSWTLDTSELLELVASS